MRLDALRAVNRGPPGRWGKELQLAGRADMFGYTPKPADILTVARYPLEVVEADPQCWTLGRLMEVLE
jgi:hypothetical protein